ncbi:MAG TPA: CPBP family intramembrane glutamic endopeptidase [Actinomycetaceae bacterium]|nr:CPBP family intramembrane glutamic endopeptidase [Actinomycetaceae bacterium]
MPPTDFATDPWLRRRLNWEVWLVLGVSLLYSAVRSVIRIVERLTAPVPLGEQAQELNVSLAARPLVDLAYQLAAVAFGLVPVLLALYLLSADRTNAFHRIGFDLRKPWRDLGGGFLLAAVIGIPGLAFYLIGREMGITVAITPAALGEYWWSVPVLLLSAAKNAILEEVLVVGYALERWRQAGWSWWKASLTSAVVRGSYHLYQGVGPFFGNLVMGLVFNEVYRRWGRTMPLVLAHFLIDVVAFVGWWLLPPGAQDFFR